MIKYIKYKGQDYPIRLSYRVFKGLKQEVKGLKQQDLENLDPALLEAMLWLGLQSGHRAEGKELTLEKDQMEDVLDECFVSFLTMIPEFFPHAKVGNAGPNLEGVVQDNQKESGLQNGPQ